MDLRLAGVALAACAVAIACERKPKRVLRTEPWPAPAVSSATPSGVPGGFERYEVVEGRVRVALGGKAAKPEATLGGVSGSIDFDPVRLERSRATLSADLLSLSVSSAGAEDPVLTARALDWLELGAERAGAERERNRFARIEIQGFEPQPAGEPPARRGRARAHGSLTLHHFRVPVEIALEVDLGPEGSDRLTIRTQQPFVLSLTAHDILPRDARGELLASGISELGTTVGREARISADITARRARRSPTGPVESLKPGP